MDEDIPKAVHALARAALDELPPDASPDVIRQTLETALSPIRGRLRALNVEQNPRSTEISFTPLGGEESGCLMFLR